MPSTTERANAVQTAKIVNPNRNTEPLRKPCFELNGELCILKFQNIWHTSSQPSGKTTAGQQEECRLTAVPIPAHLRL